jgi:hypothetical protein
MNRDEFYDDLEGGPRVDKERAAGYLHRGRPPRPQAPPQTEGLFDEPGHQARRFVELGQPAQRSLHEAPAKPVDGALFPEPAPGSRRLIPVAGWRDYRQGSTP